MPVSKIPLPRSQTSRSRLVVPATAAYLYRAQAEEDRGYLGVDWIESMTASGVRFYEVTYENDEEITVHDASSDAIVRLSLFDPESFLDHIASEGSECLWIDITALAFGSWASLIRSAIDRGVPVTVAYAEPAEYTSSPNPMRGLQFNLSKRTTGLAPIPGFARLWASGIEESILVPLLGFEGDRLQRVLEETDFDVRRTFPIIGVPGFRPEYPFISLDANSRSLNRSPLHRNIRLARANCPFEAFLAIENLRVEEQASHVTLAPIGTKPHALGALLQALRHPEGSTIVYDHPVRSERRTIGAANLCVYGVSDFIALLDSV